MTTISPDLNLDEADLQVTTASNGRVARLIRSRPNLVALGLYGLLTLIADFPIWPGDPNAVPTQLGGDILQTAWFLEWTPYALLHGHNPFFSNFINFPAGVDIAQNTGIQLLAIVTAPLTLLVSPVASENLLRYLAFALSAYACYWVLRRWTRYFPAALLGGLIYGFSPYMVTQGNFHLNLIFVPFPPLIFYALFELIVVQEHSARRWGILLGLFSVCQFYISAEVLATTALIAAMGGFFLFFLGFRYVPQKFGHALVGLVFAALVLSPLIAFPVFELLHGKAHYSGPAQGFNNVYNADLLGPLIPTKDQLVAPARLSEIGTRLVGAQIQENGSYLGIPLIAFAIYLVVRYWRRLWPLFLSLMALSAFTLSLGPLLVVDGKTHVLPIDLPFRKIAHLPVIENILPVRFSLYVVLFVALIVALGIDALRDDVLLRRLSPEAGRRRPLPHHLGRVILAAVAASSLVALIPRWPYRSLSVALGVHYGESARGLRIVPPGSTVLAYPYPTSFFDMAMLWQSLDDMKFNLLGSYALVPDNKGMATLFPSILEPKDVEAMLVNSVTEIADPELPDLVATAKSIVATRVVLLPPKGPAGHHDATMIGHVGDFWFGHSTFYLYPNHFSPVAVHFGAGTILSEPGARVPTITGIAFNARVAVYGTITTGTVDATMVTHLRSFLRLHHVDAIIIGLGITDANEIANWFRAALGPPTRAGAGSEIWTDVPKTLRRFASTT